MNDSATNESFSQTVTTTTTTNAAVLQAKAFVWTYVLPTLCVLGLGTNSVSALVFAQRKQLKNAIYRYFLWHSLADLAYLALCLGRFVNHLDAMRPIRSSFYFQFYEFYVFVYATSTLAIMMILIELLIAAKRLLIVLNLNLTVRVRFRTIVAVATSLSMLAFAPILGSFHIVPDLSGALSNQTADRWTIVPINSSHSGALRNMYISSSIFRGFVAPALLLLLNVSLAVKFRKVCRKKNYLTSSKIVHANAADSSLLTGDSNSSRRSPVATVVTRPSAEPSVTATQARRNLTKMIITINFLFVLSNMAPILNLLSLERLGATSSVTVAVSIVAYLILLATHSSGLLIYLRFDKLFRETFVAQLNRLRPSHESSERR